MNPEPENVDAQACPKRLWVMTTLSDDEFTEDSESLPQGLQFHLSRCESCRELADRLIRVGTDLRALAELTPDDALLAEADRRANEALSTGARITGRVAIPEEPEEESCAVGQPGRTRRVPYAVAAAILLAVGLFWGRGFLDSGGEGYVDGPSETLPRYTVQPKASEDSMPVEPPIPAETLAEEGSPDADPELGQEEPRVAELAQRAKRTRPKPVHPAPPSRFDDDICDDPSCVQRAFLLGGSDRRFLGYSPFDKTQPVESTIEPARVSGEE
ncbi:MAG: hypothetical protein JSU63_00395 [Phycisphaerales bacterium]|nr:MAG: hypothetical protein JSU63_00395 [Phycisphaerales bacterium]